MNNGTQRGVGLDAAGRGRGEGSGGKRFRALRLTACMLAIAGLSGLVVPSSSIAQIIRPVPPFPRPLPLPELFAEPAAVTGEFRWDQGPAASLPAGPTVGTLKGTRLFREVDSDPWSFGLAVRVGVAADLAGRDQEGFAPQGLLLQPELDAAAPIESLRGTLFAWSPEARAGGGWSARTLASRGGAGAGITGSVLPLGGPLVLTRGAGGTVIDVAAKVRAAGGFAGKAPLSVYFEDTRFAEGDARRYKRILKGAPTSSAFLQDPAFAMEHHEHASRVILGAPFRSPVLALENVLIASRDAGRHRVVRGFQSAALGRVDIDLGLRDVPDATGRVGFGHTVVEALSVRIPGAAGKKVEVYQLRKEPISAPEAPVLVGSALLGAGTVKVPLAAFEDPAPRDWFAGDLQYYRLLVVKVGEDAFVVASFRQGTDTSFEPSRGITFPY